MSDSRVHERPESVDRVAAFLKAAAAEARIDEFAAETATAAAAAEAAGCDIGEIVKTLVVVCDGKVVLALVPGDRRGDTGKIARAAGAADGRVAHAREVAELTGFEPGAVSPFALERVDRVLIERSLLTRVEVWVGAGSTRHMAVLPTRELVRVTRAAPADLVASD
jgi:prolyl-tRNA editing enzyme YbaK/EbsC (Cys-tRNA(Pro) deacylase)